MDLMNDLPIFIESKKEREHKLHFQINQEKTIELSTVYAPLYEAERIVREAKEHFYNSLARKGINNE